MKILRKVEPTPEQLPIISNPTAGVMLIRGAAGSGKTTTALLMLRQMATFWQRRHQRMGINRPVQILVLTFNRTLRGYIKELAEGQVDASLCRTTVSTFAKWALSAMGQHEMMDDGPREQRLTDLGRNLGLNHAFLVSECEYVLGRFTPDKLDDYLTCTRVGRGASPRMERATREALLNGVIRPYQKWKTAEGFMDWSDLAVRMIGLKSTMYDVIIVDEAQDFSANQIRAVMSHAANPSTVVFVLDAAQRIYPRGCTWIEAGVTINPNFSYRLAQNHRNTKEICRFAASMLAGMPKEDDGTIPDLNACTRSGPVPVVLKGGFAGQAAHVLKYISTKTKDLDPVEDSIAFLHPLGGGWFRHVRDVLNAANKPYVELTRKSEWPTGAENIALTTMYSAKGLEFDHVIILGLNDEITRAGKENDDTQFENLRRLLAMSITRARKSVILGYSPKDPSRLIQLLDKATYKEITV